MKMTIVLRIPHNCRRWEWVPQTHSTRNNVPHNAPARSALHTGKHCIVVCGIRMVQGWIVKLIAHETKRNSERKWDSEEKSLFGCYEQHVVITVAIWYISLWWNEYNLSPVSFVGSLCPVIPLKCNEIRKSALRQWAACFSLSTIETENGIMETVFNETEMENNDNVTLS